MRIVFFSAVALASALMAPSATAQARLEARVDCQETHQRLVYDCTVRIMDAGAHQVVEGLAVQVKADMPSMPMAHNIAPVAARPAAQPGVYAFPIKLDMYGKWAFSVRVSGPREDLLVDVLDLQPEDSGQEGHSHGKH